MSVQRHIYPDPQSAAQACAGHIIAQLEEARSGRRYAALAVSGGSTPKLLFQQLVASGFQWDRVHLFWVDERAAPPADPQSNYRLAEESLIIPARIPASQVHRIHGEQAPAAAAQKYADEIREFFRLPEGVLPRFDVVQRGMGTDAHTASLFPGESCIDDRQGMAAAVYVPKLAQWRITLLPGVLLAARHTACLVTGADKAAAVHAVFQQEYDPKRYPAQIGLRQGGEAVWFLDQAAAGQVKGPDPAGPGSW